MEREYVLGTDDEEIARLGLQHLVWRPWMLEAWRRAGITRGTRVLDIGAGPGFATADLAEVVGETGEDPVVWGGETFFDMAACRPTDFVVPIEATSKHVPAAIISARR